MFQCYPNSAGESGDLAQLVYTREVTSKNADFCLIVSSYASLNPPKLTLYLLSTSTLAQRYLKFGILRSSVASLTFSLKLIT